VSEKLKENVFQANIWIDSKVTTMIIMIISAILSLLHTTIEYIIKIVGWWESELKSENDSIGWQGYDNCFLRSKGNNI